MELPNQGKQTEPVLVEDRFGPSEFLIIAVGSDDEGAMKARSGDDVPGVASQGTCAEAAHVIHKVSYDHFDDFMGKYGGGG